MDNSLESVTKFLEDTQNLVQDIRNTGQQAADQIAILAGKVDESKEEVTALAANLGQPFQVSPDAATKAQQQVLLNRISDISKKIDKFQNAPDITTELLADRAELYVALANTFDQAIGQIVQFTPDDITQINALLKQAALDAASRQRWADVLNAAVQLTEIALKIGLKVAAA